MIKQADLKNYYPNIQECLDVAIKAAHVEGENQLVLSLTGTDYKLLTKAGYRWKVLNETMFGVYSVLIYLGDN